MLQIPGDDGSLRPLVISERVLYEAVGRAPDRREPPSWILPFLAEGFSERPADIRELARPEDDQRYGKDEQKLGYTQIEHYRFRKR